MRGIVYDGESTTLVEGLELRAPGPREVVVEIVAAGMCHSDLSFMSGLYPWPVPAVCGHEGAGIVAEVGEAVTHVKPGDHVIIATLAACGFCDQCNNGRPTSCRQTLGNASEIFTLDGKGVSNFAAASVFADRTVVKDVQVVPIPDDVPLTSAALVGCGVVTGMGAVLNRANVELGQTAAVFGVGGVGLNVIQALKVKGARRIVAVDVATDKEGLAEAVRCDRLPRRVARRHRRRDRRARAVQRRQPRGPFNAGGVDWSFDCVAFPKSRATRSSVSTGAAPAS